MNKRLLVAAAVVGVLVTLWWTRYQPLPAGGLMTAAFIDRWTGRVYTIGNSGKLVEVPPRETAR